MNTLSELLNPGWVGSVIGLFGIVAAIVTFRISRIGPRPVFKLRVLRLISRKAQVLPSDIEIRFKDTPVQHLMRTQIIFWNSGTALVRGSDIVEHDPLRFAFKSPGEILSAEVLNSVRPANKVQATFKTEDPTVVQISFDYLDPGDGATIDVLHTCESGIPTVSGTIRGVPRGVLDWGRLATSIRNQPASPALVRVFRTITLVTVLIGVWSIASAVFLPEIFNRITTLIFGFLAVLAGLSLLLDTRALPRRLRPEDPWL